MEYLSIFLTVYLYLLLLTPISSNSYIPWRPSNALHRRGSIDVEGKSYKCISLVLIINSFKWFSVYRVPHLTMPASTVKSVYLGGGTSLNLNVITLIQNLSPLERYYTDTEFESVRSI